VSERKHNDEMLPGGEGVSRAAAGARTPDQEAVGTKPQAPPTRGDATSLHWDTFSSAAQRRRRWTDVITSTCSLFPVIDTGILLVLSQRVCPVRSIKGPHQILVVDFVERSVTGLLVPARIDKSDAVHVEFSGQDDSFSVLGSIDRIGGIVRVIIAALHPTESSPFSYRWDLLCKPVKPV
jgi:hypothetical protein